MCPGSFKDCAGLGEAFWVSGGRCSSLPRRDRDATGKDFILSTVDIYFHLLYGLKNLGGGEKARNQICGPRRMGCRCSRVLREFEALFWGEGHSLSPHLSTEISRALILPLPVLVSASPFESFGTLTSKQLEVARSEILGGPLLAATAMAPAFNFLGHHLPWSSQTHGPLSSKPSAYLGLMTNCKVTGQQQDQFSHPYGARAL